MRRPFVAGNWKMNLDLAAARQWVAEVRSRCSTNPPLDVAVCPPFVYLFPMAKAIDGTPFRLGAQNCWSAPRGAFTGEVSAAMIRETGCTYVILGHSERRHTIGPPADEGQVRGETDAMVAAKARAAMAAGLTPIICVGETLPQREANATEAVLDRQLAGSLEGLDCASDLVIAYEPVWAIGTGRNATPDQAQAAHAHIRRRLREQCGPAVAEAVRIQYGGSVKPENARELMAQPDVDGALVGGASLVAADFAAIIESCIQAKGLAARSR